MSDYPYSASDDYQDALEIPALNDLIQFGRVSYEFHFPGKKEDHVVKMGILEHHELLAASIEAGKVDMLSRAMAMQQAVLSRAILEIDGVNYDPSHPENHMKLKKMLEHTSQPTIELLWKTYDELRSMQEIGVVGDRVREIQKKYKGLDYLAMTIGSSPIPKESCGEIVGKSSES